VREGQKAKEGGRDRGEGEGEGEVEGEGEGEGGDLINHPGTCSRCCVFSSMLVWFPAGYILFCRYTSSVLSHQKPAFK